MIKKYYNSILEQVFAQIGKKEHNMFWQNTVMIFH